MLLQNIYKYMNIKGYRYLYNMYFNSIHELSPHNVIIVTYNSTYLKIKFLTNKLIKRVKFSIK